MAFRNAFEFLNFKVLSRGAIEAVYFERTKYSATSWANSAFSINLIVVFGAENAGICRFV